MTRVDLSFDGAKVCHRDGGQVFEFSTHEKFACATFARHFYIRNLITPDFGHTNSNDTLVHSKSISNFIA
jgi:hypothetical protein